MASDWRFSRGVPRGENCRLIGDRLDTPSYLSVGDPSENFECIHPYLSATMSATPLQTPAGWNLIGTGGGCTAFARDLSGNLRWLITDDAEAPVAADAPCTLSLLNGSDHLLFWECSCLSEALAIADGSKS